MISISITNVFENEECQEIIARSESIGTENGWIDGQHTAGKFISSIKQNQQLSRNGNQRWLSQLLDRIIQNQSINYWSMPARAIEPCINRYRPGDFYQRHVDAPLQSGIRADWSYTCFLSPPQTYDGGELRLQLANKTQDFKPKAGTVVLYTSGLPHEVLPVTCGTRYAAIGWIQSAIRDPLQRDILSRTRRILQKLMAEREYDETIYGLSQIEADLTRMWIEI